MVWVRLSLLGLLLAQYAWSGEDKPRGNRDVPTPLSVLEVPAQTVNVILGRPESDSVTLNVLAYDNFEASLSCGEVADASKAKTQKLKLEKGVPQDTVLHGLKPSTQYEYVLAARSAAPVEIRGTFHTQRSKGQPFVFTIQADSHLDFQTTPALYARTLSNAIADKPDFHIDLGDTFMTEKLPNRDICTKQYLAQRYYFSQIGRTVPVFLTLGNHDGESGRYLDGTGENLAVWCNSMRKKYFPNPIPNAFYTGNVEKDKAAGILQDYFAWEWGDAQFIVLDPFWYTPRLRGSDDNWGKTLGRAQYDWLKQTLEKSSAAYRFVFIHHLVGGTDRQARGGKESAGFYEWGGKNVEGVDEFRTKRAGWPAPIHALFVKNHVTAVFHGHDHLFVKQDLDGIVYQDVPQPGMAKYDNTRSAPGYGYLSGEIQGSSGHLRVAVAPEKITVDYIRAYLPDDERGDRKNGRSSYTYTMTPR